MQIESQLAEFLQGGKVGSLGELSARQVPLVDELQGRTIAKERALSTQIAGLQEDMLDQPIAELALLSEGAKQGETSRNVDAVLDKHGAAMAAILEEADRLRMTTVREIVKILTPSQAVDFLAAGKKIRLCMQDWGRKRDEDHGR